jgi:hypothetical protein
VFILVAMGVVLFPMGLLGLFEGIENGQGKLAIPTNGGHHEAETTNVSASEDSVKSVTSSVAITSNPTSSPRNDLPERELTLYVDPIIGTEGPGHCTLHSIC